MADRPSIDAPAYQQIELESGPFTSAAIQRIWQFMQDNLRKQGSSINAAKDLVEPISMTSTVTTNQNDFDVKGYSVVLFTGASAIDITGFTAPEASKAKVLFIHNTGAGTKTLKHESASSQAANRIYANGAADIAVAQDQSVRLVYLSSRWRQI